LIKWIYIIILFIQSSDRTNHLPKNYYLSILKQKTPTFDPEGHKRSIKLLIKFNWKWNIIVYLWLITYLKYKRQIGRKPIMCGYHIPFQTKVNLEMMVSSRTRVRPKNRPKICIFYLLFSKLTPNRLKDEFVCFLNKCFFLN
jgi:hypothetical protein